MMRKALLALLGALTVGLALFVPAVPAGALTSTPAACASKSGLGYNVTVCAVYSWRFQNDGTGVHVEKVNVYAFQGCGDLEDKAFDSMVAQETQTGNVDAFGPQYPCNWTWDIELNGPDKGNAVVSTQVGVNVDLASDFTVNLICDIKPQAADDCQGFVV